MVCLVLVVGVGGLFFFQIPSVKGVCANVSLAEHILLLCLAKYVSAFEF